jgi:hypothetical protein
MTVGMVFLACAILSVGCGNPEAPKIENVRLSYWDSIPPKPEDPDWEPDWEPGWESLEDGEIAPQSPVRIQGTVTDNTAVVNPRIAWIGLRDDVDEEDFKECSDGVKEFYECEMECKETRQGFFECSPLLPAAKLIRGDRYTLTMTTKADETFELEVAVAEAQDLLVPESESEPINVQENYRVLRVSSLNEDPNPFLWSLFQRKKEGGSWLPLRSGDVLALGSGDSAFQIAVEEPEGMELESPPNATWRSLVKWNNEFFLNWDARSGAFTEQFQLFDPRVEGQMIDGVGAPTYRYVVSAQDVPDQKTDVFRSTEVAAELLFSPDSASEDPDLELEGEDEDFIKTTSPAELIDGQVESSSGEVRSLLYMLSKGPESTDGRVQYVDSDLISLTGRFSATVVYVSDWNGDGIIDEEGEEGGILNYVEAVALDVQGNWARTPVSFVFVLPTSTDASPELEIRQLFPALDKNGEALLPFGEEVRLRARAADDRGQPRLSGWQCDCVAEEVPINEDRCPCGEVQSGDLNAGGEFPVNPWEWIVIEPVSQTRESIAVLRATEKVERRKDIPEAKFTSIEINLEPEGEAHKMTVGIPETRGPAVTLKNLQNGDIVEDPNAFIVEASMIRNISKLNQITALYNGLPQGTPTYTSLTGAFFWDLQGVTVQEGDRICVGAVSVDGHATLNVLEFANTEEGLLVGVTVTPNLAECRQNTEVTGNALPESESAEDPQEPPRPVP